MSFVRKIKKGNNIYLAEVENKRKNGKVVQKVIRYIGKEVNGNIIRRINPDTIKALSVKQYADILVIHRISEMLGLLDLIKNWYILAFVYSHLLTRKSIKKIEEWFTQTEIGNILGIKEIKAKQLYESLDEINEMRFEGIEEAIYRKVKDKEVGGGSAIIDVTDTYFEGKGIESKARRGKDGKYKKLIQIGLGVTERYGFPIMMKIYGGNISNLMIFKDLFIKLREKGLKTVIIDRGMGSESNIKEVLKAGMRIIAGLKKTAEIKEKYLKRIKRETIYQLSNRVKLKQTSVYVKEYRYKKGKIIVVYNPQIEVIKREQIYERGEEGETKYVGYSIIYHNTEWSAEEVTKRYYEKEIVERAFKKMKGILSMRPIRVWRKEHIKGHLRICYLSYAILSLLEYYLNKKKIGYSAIEILEKLKSGYKIYLEDKKTNYSWQTTVLLEKKLHKLFDYLNVVYKNR